MTIDALKGSAPFQIVSQAKIQIALAENGKSLLKLQPLGAEEYWLISDGKKTWSYLPAKKEYTEEEAASLAPEGNDAREEPETSPSGTITERYARQAVQNIADFTKAAQSVASTKSMPLKIGKEKVTWPVLHFTEKPDEDGTEKVAEMAMSPDSPVLGHLAWAEIHHKGSDTTTIRVNILFSSFSVGEAVAEELFAFDPPKRAKLVEELAIPGQPGSVLVNHLSPDFEARTLTGEKIKLSDLHGKVVMLNFWASWCPPCRAELPTVSKLYNEFKEKGLVVYGVNDEERGTARKYLEKEGLTLPTIDDSSEKAHRLYRVSAIPTVFLISADGKVVKWMRGGHNEESLRTALKSVGIGQ